MFAECGGVLHEAKHEGEQKEVGENTVLRTPDTLWLAAILRSSGGQPQPVYARCSCGSDTIPETRLQVACKDCVIMWWQ